MIHAKTWKFGHNIDTDIIIPARHLVLPLDEMKNFAMAPVDSEFARKVTDGDVIVAGQNFGCGSSREQAPALLKALGIKAIVAIGFARIFFRNAINIGLLVLECPNLYDYIENGDTIEIDPASGKIYLPGEKKNFSSTKLPPFLLEIVAAGGLVPFLTSTS
jgi:3-isopropylmalate/(R)-2-methylmalate dehydratase small subunit